MKAAVITINDNDNYGNRLQNYALCRIVQDMGVRAESIITNRQALSSKDRLRYLIWRAAGKRGEKYLPFRTRPCYFMEFNRRIPHAGYFIGAPSDLRKMNRRYDWFLYGSDQIWNPEFAHDYAVQPKTDPKKNLAVSASFGVNSIPEAQRQKYQDGLKNFSRISVREARGAELVRDFLGTEAAVLPDPTICVPAEEWRRIERKPSYLLLEKPYIMLYFLGRISDERKKSIRALADREGCVILNLSREKFRERTGPAEFLYVVSHARAVLTDSFHACVFSVIDQVPFYVLNREDSFGSMNSRISNFLRTFGLQEQKKEIPVCINKDIYKGSQTEDILLEERRKLNTWLRETMDLKNRLSWR